MARCTRLWLTTRRAMCIRSTVWMRTAATCHIRMRTRYPLTTFCTSTIACRSWTNARRIRTIRNVDWMVRMAARHRRYCTRASHPRIIRCMSSTRSPNSDSRIELSCSYTDNTINTLVSPSWNDGRPGSVARTTGGWTGCMNAPVSKAWMISCAVARRLSVGGSRTPGHRHMYEWTNAACENRRGYPVREILAASSTPEHRSCSATRGSSNTSGLIMSLGFTHRMKWGFVVCSNAKRLASCDLNLCTTVVAWGGFDDDGAGREVTPNTDRYKSIHDDARNPSAWACAWSLFLSQKPSPT
ncbi:hypothetical protein, variant 5 [Aphanomyces astaci]|uniref:Uncharacterized protein n=1 Tax=Aphanomyces astaci TaxID=112090 RepID=W4G584_APHAT|nr:hypothetical protein H257_10897 [Aphanomyces astaci]XP_009835935.1 hypothetical protein, variant 1 [Aphanomyces astaci]XP_009835936.1 hypothetical protein, variant 2 [Aphanomyces astaci]XP_009835937.1 hypothetical protein, variant 3 [Aphanomyces astaci]XP_009835938.1 hypothetical protein, variant 6 [Aphanomyces astaci]XP_009835939.1 hypothetical protein, variant 7 [Aphanomyces astaci]XP_009835940.1 hypothetical protein, variant 8 [Aphanomyces astaci]XP_009835941.1 hypothetical protein, va|eukprot:XP_009835934.1 hypothetical protein H257_10897 [Aphanomyces astaci]